MRIDVDDKFIMRALAVNGCGMSERDSQLIDIKDVIGKFTKETVLESIGYYLELSARGEYDTIDGAYELTDVATVPDTYCIVPGVKIYEVLHCDDGSYRMFPMEVKTIVEHGAINMRNNEPQVWNIYAENEYCKGYFSFYDLNERYFTDFKKALAKIKELEQDEK